MSREGDIAAAAARLWAGRDPEALLSSGARDLNPGTATDWGLPASAWQLAASGTAISLAGGIPDPSTLPKAELLEALGETLGGDDDGALTYGGGLGFEGLREHLAERSTHELGLPATAAALHAHQRLVGRDRNCLRGAARPRRHRPQRVAHVLRHHAHLPRPRGRES